MIQSLLIPPGIALAAYQLYRVHREGLRVEAIQTIFVPGFAILLSLWSTIFLERWKRKSSELAFRWDSDARIDAINPNFWGQETFNPIKRVVERNFSSSRKCRRQFFMALPMVFMVGVVVAIFFGFVYFEQHYVANQSGSQGSIFSILSGAVQGLIIACLNFFYKEMAVKSTDFENHKTLAEYEDSLIVKIFLFQCVNGNLALFNQAFVQRDMVALWMLLIVLMTGKQIFQTAKQLLLPKLLVWVSRLRVLRRAFVALPGKIARSISENSRRKTVNQVQPIVNAAKVEDRADQTVHPTALREAFENCAMLKDNGTVDDYAEMVSQYSYLAFWGSVFPLAPLFACGVNFLQIRGEISLLTVRTKRCYPEPADDIGIWINLLEIIGLLSVMINAALIVLTFDTQSLISDVMPALGESPQSVQVSYFVLTVIVFEHIVISLKLCIAALVSDSPHWVRVQSQVEKYRERTLFGNAVEEAENEALA